MEADKGKRHTVWASAEHVAEFEKMLSLEKEFPGKSLARDEQQCFANKLTPTCMLQLESIFRGKVTKGEWSENKYKRYQYLTLPRVLQSLHVC